MSDNSIHFCVDCKHCDDYSDFGGGADCQALTKGLDLVTGEQNLYLCYEVRVLQNNAKQCKWYDAAKPKPRWKILLGNF